MAPQFRRPQPVRLRHQELRQLLEEQRDSIRQVMRVRMRGVRDEGDAEAGGVLDNAELSEADVQTDLELALVEMQRETLVNIEAALADLNEGAYGLCHDCRGEIATARLRALPFAIRCKACEEAHEAEGRHIPMEGEWRRLSRRFDRAA